MIKPQSNYIKTELEKSSIDDQIGRIDQFDSIFKTLFISNSSDFKNTLIRYVTLKKIERT